MLNTQANALVGLISKAGLDPADFVWKETALVDYSYGGAEDYVTDMLMYRPTEEMREGAESPGTFFAFGRADVLYQPGNQRLRDQWAARMWQEKVMYFVQWLDNVKREAVPSLWESIATSTTVSAGTLTIPRTPFTPEEQAKIHVRLEAMAQQIAALDTVTQEQKRLIRAELRNIDEAKGRMDRGEWLRFAIGGIITVLLASDVQHSVAASLMRGAVLVFHSLVTGHPIPPFLP